MKMIITFLMLMVMVGAGATAAESKASLPTEYKFKFVLSKETYEFKSTAQNWETAFERAAQACYTHFKAGRHLSEDQGLDIIDTCANPKKI